MSQNRQNGIQKPPPKWVQKTHQKMMIFSTLKCGSSVVNTSKINECRVLVLAPFLVSFWRCFGSPNGGQGHQKAISKKTKTNEPKLVPKRVPNGANIIKNDVLEASSFKGGFHIASRTPPGSILERFWDRFGTIFISCSDIVGCFL